MILIHICTGGFTHMLCTTGISLEFAESHGHKVAMVSERHRAFEMKFWDFFESTNVKHLLADDECVLGSYRDFNSAHPGLSASPWALECEWDKERMMHKISTSCGTNEILFDLRLPPPAACPHLFITTGFTKPCARESGEVCSWQEGLEYSLTHLKLSHNHASAVNLMQSPFSEPYIGAHYRNSDKTNDIKDLISKVERARAKTGLANLYWATDDPSSVDRIRNCFQELNIVATNNRVDSRLTRSGNLHYCSDDELSAFGTSRSDLLYSFLRDIIMLVEASEVCYSSDTDVTRMIKFFRANRELYLKFFQSS